MEVKSSWLKISIDRRYAVDACTGCIMKMQIVLPRHEKLRRMFNPDIETRKQRTGAFIIREMHGNRPRKSEPAQVLGLKQLLESI